MFIFVFVKKIILILLLIASLASQSQVLITLLLGDKLNSDGLEFGLEGGVNWSTISGLETKSFDNHFNLGFYFDIRIKNQWFFYTGVLVKSSLGVTNLTNNDLKLLGATQYVNLNRSIVEGVYRHKMSYFIVPMLFKYKLKNYFYTELGPQVGLMYKSWIEFESDIDGKDAIVKEYNKEDINKIDAGFTAGIGYHLLKGTGWTIGLRYYYGLVDVYKSIKGTPNSSLFLKLNIPIGAGEKPEKENNTK